LQNDSVRLRRRRRALESRADHSRARPARVRMRAAAVLLPTATARKATRGLAHQGRDWFHDELGLARIHTACLPSPRLRSCSCVRLRLFGSHFDSVEQHNDGVWLVPHLACALSSSTVAKRNGARASLARLERSSPTFLLSLATGGISHPSGQAPVDAQATNQGKKRKMLHRLMLGRVDTSYQSRPKASCLSGIYEEALPLLETFSRPRDPKHAASASGLRDGHCRRVFTSRANLKYFLFYLSHRIFKRIYTKY
jgi:hypothetical protein